jgi:uncharacterized protein
MAVHHNFPDAVSLGDVMSRIGFVQADPITSPARAQDLILRQRVTDYRRGDLERTYPDLGLDEAMFYAYGFFPRDTARWMAAPDSSNLSDMETRVLDFLRRSGAVTSTHVAMSCGNDKVPNYWGGQSRQSKMALDTLHRRALIRVSRREKGRRYFEIADDFAPLPDQERYLNLVRLALRVLAPVPWPSIRSVAASLRRRVPSVKDHVGALNTLLRLGEVERHVIEDMAYLVLPGPPAKEMPLAVRVLAPFDPLVWDRRRFEHLWDWTYKFEAYTPVAKRVRGYYAMPLLFGDDVVGWVNVRDGKAEVGFAKGRPSDTRFDELLEEELQRICAF